MKQLANLQNVGNGAAGLSVKLESLKSILFEMGGMLIAYSGGVDSTLLLKVAHGVLGAKVLAVTARSETYPSKELKEAEENAKMLGVKHIFISTSELDDENFTSNPPERCYYCKRELLSKLVKLARQYELNYVVDGSNYDDLKDFRPGMKAVSEFGIRSPLKEAMLTKEEIRALLKEMNLPTWDKPPQPCLATRFPYGATITKEKLSKVELAEEFLAAFGVRQLRVRVHDDIARIEVPREDMLILLDEDTCNQIVGRYKALGYTYITLDIQGYRMGSMNEPLQREN